jgi:hypothetical protein
VDRPGRLQQAMAAILMTVTLWLMLPEHQRRLIVMRATALGQRLTARAAHAEGHAGMGNELAGRPEDAERHYQAATTLSRARDAFSRALDSMRP